MFKLHHRIYSTGLVLSLIATVFFATGCPFLQPDAGNVKLLFTATSGTSVSKGGTPVDLEDIEEFTAVIDSVLLRPAAGSDENAETVLMGPLAVDMLDLAGMAHLFASAYISPGSYEELVVNMSSAMFMLKEEAKGVSEYIVIDEIQNGGVLVAPGMFEVEAGSQIILVLDFGEIIVAEMDGMHSLSFGGFAAAETPEGIDAQVVGVIDDLTDTTFVLEVGDDDYDVDYSAAGIYLPGDTTAPSGMIADLSEGAAVAVFGNLGKAGSLNAIAVLLLPEGGENGTHPVDIFDSMFSPPLVIINPGDTVEWTSKTELPNSVTSTLEAEKSDFNPLFDLVFQEIGEVGSLIFTRGDGCSIEIEINTPTLSSKLNAPKKRPTGQEEGSVEGEGEAEGEGEGEAEGEGEGEAEGEPECPEDVVFEYFSKYNTDNMRGLIVVRLADDDGKITICHHPPGNPANAHTIRISENALLAHLQHGDHVVGGVGGDTIGPCENPRRNRRVTICHYPDGGDPSIITVSENALAAHLSHGDEVKEESDRPGNRQN